MKNIGIPPLWEIATAINFLLYYYTIKSLVSLQIQGFFAGKNQKKRAVSSLLQPPPPFVGRKPCCTRQRSKPFRSNSPFLMSKRCHAALCVFRLPLFVCSCHSLLATVPQPVENKTQRGIVYTVWRKGQFNRPASLPQTPNKNGCSKTKKERKIKNDGIN